MIEKILKILMFETLITKQLMIIFYYLFALMPIIFLLYDKKINNKLKNILIYKKIKVLKIKYIMILFIIYELLLRIMTELIINYYLITEKLSELNI